MSSKVSIVVPVYNVNSGYMKICIGSILKQTYKNIEVVLVDDGSTDDSGNLCDEFARSDFRVMVLHQQNQGVSAARNNGTDVATGEYVMYVDADDITSLFMVQEAINAIESTDADLVIGAITKISDYNEFSASEFDISMGYYVGTADLIDQIRKQYLIGSVENFNKIKGNGYINRGPCSRIMRMELAKNNRFIKELSIGEDVLWNMTLLNRCNTVCVVPNIWYGYLIYGNSAIRKYHGNREKIAALYLRRLWDENEKYCSTHIEEYAKCVAVEFYCILNYELLSNKCEISNKDKRDITRCYFDMKPWNLLKQPGIKKRLPLIYRVLFTLVSSGFWIELLKVNKLIRGY